MTSAKTSLSTLKRYLSKLFQSLFSWTSKYNIYSIVYLLLLIQEFFLSTWETQQSWKILDRFPAVSIYLCSRFPRHFSLMTAHLWRNMGSISQELSLKMWCWLAGKSRTFHTGSKTKTITIEDPAGEFKLLMLVFRNLVTISWDYIMEASKIG